MFGIPSGVRKLASNPALLSKVKQAADAGHLQAQAVMHVMAASAKQLQTQARSLAKVKDMAGDILMGDQDAITRGKALLHAGLVAEPGSMRSLFAAALHEALRRRMVSRASYLPAVDFGRVQGDEVGEEDASGEDDEAGAVRNRAPVRARSGGQRLSQKQLIQRLRTLCTQYQIRPRK